MPPGLPPSNDQPDSSAFSPLGLGAFVYSNDADDATPAPWTIEQYARARAALSESEFILWQRGFMDRTANSVRSSTAPAAKPKRAIKQLDPARTQSLLVALHNYMHKREMSLRARNVTTERREAEYLNLIENENHNSLSVSDILNSEQPIYLEDISTDLFVQIGKPNHRDYIVVEDVSIVVCSTCDTEISRYYAFMCLGRVYCSEHIPQVKECVACHYVGKEPVLYAGPEGQKVYVCNNCKVRLCCKICNTRISPEMAEVGQCQHCYTTPPPSNEYPRRYSLNARWMSKDKTKFIQSDRIFSAELETVLPSRSEISELLSNVPLEMGLSGDGSISGPGRGVELQTPRLQGARGEELITRVVAALKSAGASVNESCGFHTHLDAADLFPENRSDYPQAIIDVWKAHLIFEEVILSFLPYRRRNNRYCRPMRDYFKLSELNALSNMFEVEKLWYKQRSYANLAHDKAHHYHASRYFGFNLHSLLGERNLEIRYHTGTLNAKKIFHWVGLHALIMDAAARGGFDFGFLEEAQATVDLKEKTQMLFERTGINQASQRYFFERQKKFGDKAQMEDEGVFTASRVPPFVEIQTRYSAPFTRPGTFTSFGELTDTN